MKKRFSEEQIVCVLREARADRALAAVLLRTSAAQRARLPDAGGGSKAVAGWSYDQSSPYGLSGCKKGVSGQRLTHMGEVWPRLESGNSRIDYLGDLRA